MLISSQGPILEGSTNSLIVKRTCVRLLNEVVVEASIFVAAPEFITDLALKQQ